MDRTGTRRPLKCGPLARRLPDGRAVLTAEGDALVRDVVAAYPRLRLLLAGHARGRTALRLARLLGVTDDEVQSAAFVGLWQAARRLDPARAKLATAAYWGILSAVQSECERRARDRRLLQWDDALHEPVDRGAAPDEPLGRHAAPGRDPAALARLMNRLDRRHRLVLRMRYGFDGPPLRLRQIGDRLKVSKERVRQLQEEAPTALWRAWREHGVE